MVYRTDRRTLVGSGCHCVISAFYAAGRFRKFVWHWRREPDFPAAWKWRSGKCRKSGAFVIWTSGMATLFYSFLIFCFGAQALSVLGTDGETLVFAEQYLFWTVVTGGIPMESGSCQYCPCSGTGRDSGYRDVGRQNSKCAA